MKHFIRCVSLILVFSVFLATPALATEPRSSDYFVSNYTYLYKTSNTSFQVWFDTLAFDTMSELGVSSITIQLSTSSTSGWVDIKTFTPSGYPQMMGSNVASHCNCVSYSGAIGYYYRACVEFYARNSSGSAYSVIYTTPIPL